MGGKVTVVPMGYPKIPGVPMGCPRDTRVPRVGIGVPVYPRVSVGWCAVPVGIWGPGGTHPPRWHP